MFILKGNTFTSVISLPLTDDVYIKGQHFHVSNLPTALTDDVYIKATERQ